VRGIVFLYIIFVGIYCLLSDKTFPNLPFSYFIRFAHIQSQAATAKFGSHERAGRLTPLTAPKVRILSILSSQFHPFQVRICHEGWTRWQWRNKSMVIPSKNKYVALIFVPKASCRVCPFALSPTAAFPKTRLRPTGIFQKAGTNPASGTPTLTRRAQ